MLFVSCNQSSADITFANFIATIVLESGRQRCASIKTSIRNSSWNATRKVNRHFRSTWPYQQSRSKDSCARQWVITLRPRQNGRHFPDDNLKRIFLNENVWISIKFSLNFVPRGPIKKFPALAQIMAWRRPGDKPLSGPMMVRLPTHICVTRPQWVIRKDTGSPYISPYKLNPV